MATPMTPTQWLAALKAEGVHVAEHVGWRDHERDAATGKSFGPVHGVLIHHTAGTNSLTSVWSGRPDLPGPLAHAHLAKSALCTLTSSGRANHAGLAAVNAYNAILNESATHPKPSKASGTIDGNDVLYGIEIENLGNGHDPYPANQYDTAVRWAAAICRHHGWGKNSIAGHKETSVEGKVDPSFDMNTFRADVAERLAHPASWNPGSSTTPPEEPAVSSTIETHVESLFTNLMTIGSKTEVDAKGDRVNHAAGYFLANIEEDTALLRVQVAALTKAVAELTALVKTLQS